MAISREIIFAAADELVLPMPWYFPKGTDLSQYSQRCLTKVAEEMNNRPRKSLGSLRPAEVMSQKLKELYGGVVVQN